MAQSTAEELGQTGTGDGHGHGGGHHGAHADPFLAHHFDTPKHQFEAGKLGIWIFLAQEVLFFSALFCAYAIYRALHPEIFIYAHYYLDTFWGGFNTVVLIVSSLTAALAVRYAQLGQQKKLVICIILTIACAFGFLGVKYVEYSHKFHDNILPGKHFNPTEPVWELDSYKAHEARFGNHAPGPQAPITGPTPMPPAAAPAAAAPGMPAAAPGAPAAAPGAPAPGAAAPGTPGTPASAAHGAPAAEAAQTAEVAQPPPGALQRPRNVGVFFSIYFCMTGLHGIHVIAGIIVWAWILKRALRGEFGPTHFGAVDYAALYWHLVDLIWIYLFPLLYLIH
jgi:cytochrome c oxidase subunit 3